MFDSSDPMRHLQYFEKLAGLQDEDVAWKSVSAGLVLLRLVDAWMQDGSVAVALDSWGVRSVRAAIEEMPSGTPARAILMSCLDALIDARCGDVHAIAPRLMAYARSLELEAEWALAVDVYETALAHVRPAEEPEIAVNALLRRGFSLQELAQFDEAAEAFKTASAVAERSGDMMGMLRARIGEAKLVVKRGNLPAADNMYVDAVAIANEHGLREARSMAIHGRAEVALAMGQYDRSVRLAYDAMRDSAKDSERDRILNDLAGAFYLLGVRSAARDAFLILAATAQEQYLRWLSTINLMELAAGEGMELQFERYRQQLCLAPLPPHILAQFELHAGAGYRTLGDEPSARSWFRSALDTATTYSFHQVAWAAEDALLRTTEKRERNHMVAPVEISGDLEVIATELSKRRRLAEAS